MKKLLVTIMTGVLLVGFTACEQADLVPIGSGETENVNLVGPQALTDEQREEVAKPEKEPAVNIALGIEERIEKIEN